MRRRQIQLPRTSARRSAVCHLKLLYFVTEPASTGFDFKGTDHRCGAWIDLEALWPTRQYPLTPLLLESTQGDTVVSLAGRKRLPSVHVVWQFDLELHSWTEIARFSGHGLDWVDHLTPLIRKLLSEDGRPPEPAPDLNPAIRRIVAAVERELTGFSEQQARCELLEGVHDYFSGELAYQRAPPGHQLRWNWGAFFDGRFDGA